jgi:hypothetical protein
VNPVHTRPQTSQRVKLLTYESVDHFVGPSIECPPALSKTVHVLDLQLPINLSCQGIHPLCFKTHISLSHSININRQSGVEEDREQDKQVGHVWEKERWASEESL